MQVSFKNVGHYFATVGRGFVKAAQLLAKLQPAVAAAEPFVEAGTLMAGAPPAAVDVEKAAFAAYGHVATAINAGSPINPDGSLNAVIGPEVVAAVKSTMDTVNAFAAVQGIQKPALPFSAPAPAAS